MFFLPSLACPLFSSIEFFGKTFQTIQLPVQLTSLFTNLPIPLLGRTGIASEDTRIFPYIGVIKFSLRDNSGKNSDVHLCIISGSIDIVFKALKHTSLTFA